MKKTITSSALACCFLANPSFAANNLNISAILNFGYTDRAEFSGINTYGIGEHSEGLKQGFWTDHSEIALSSAIDDLFYGKLALALDEHEGELELELEEAFIQTTALPYALSVRAGRFLSDVGYLNNKHSHTDNFADRPLVYRTFLNNHYYDDGVRVNWLAPTDMYLSLGSEVFSGNKLPAYSKKNVGAHSVFIKAGDDFNASNSWQIGAAYLNTNNQGTCDSHEHEEDIHTSADLGAHEHEYEESFELCDFSGKKNYTLLDATWKWAPNGNYKYENFTLSAEYFIVHDKGSLSHEEHHEDEITADEHADDDESLLINAKHRGFYLSGVYQFTPNWAAGLRYSEINFKVPYDTDFTPSVSSAMLEYKHSHFSTIRLQYNQDKSSEALTDDQITLQFTMALGAHGAHAY